MQNIKQNLKNWFNLKSGKASHVALGLLTYLGSSQAIGMGLAMAGLPGGAFLVGGIAGCFIGFGNYRLLQSRQTATTPNANLARNVGLTLAAGFGAAAAGMIFTAGAVALPVTLGLAAAGGAAQYLASPKKGENRYNMVSWR